MVFHGSDRNPRLARDNAIPLAEAGCALTVAPFFAEATFPRWAYQFGGIGELRQEDGLTKFRLKPRDRRTGQLVLDLIDRLREMEGRPTMPYFLIGHSAGAQFLSRFAAFFANEASRIVLANPGSYVVPLRERRYPYGLGGLTIVAEADRRRYLGFADRHSPGEQGHSAERDSTRVRVRSGRVGPVMSAAGLFSGWRRRVQRPTVRSLRGRWWRWRALATEVPDSTPEQKPPWRCSELRNRQAVAHPSMRFAVGDGQDHSLRAVRRVEFAHDVLNMNLYRILGELQVIGDPLVGMPFLQQCQNIRLPCREGDTGAVGARRRRRIGRALLLRRKAFLDRDRP